MHQFSSLRAEIQPSFIGIVNGIPPSPLHSWRPEAITRLNEINDISGTEEFDASTLDYRETLTTLLNIYQDHAALERLVISPTGSKMQAVAVGIFRTFMQDVQIAYPTPDKFAEPENYTIGAKSVYFAANPLSAKSRMKPRLLGTFFASDAEKRLSAHS